MRQWYDTLKRDILAIDQRLRDVSLLIRLHDHGGSGVTDGDKATLPSRARARSGRSITTRWTYAKIQNVSAASSLSGRWQPRADLGTSKKSRLDSDAHDYRHVAERCQPDTWWQWRRYS
jgi:hypothetical protein